MNKKTKSLVFLFLGHLSNDFYPGMVSPLLPIFTVQYGWSMAQAGLLITAMQISCNLSQPVFGIINDHKPTKSFLWIGLIVAGLPFCFVMKIDSLHIMAFAMIISGIGVGMFHPVSAVAVGQIALEKRRGISMALFSSGGYIGFMIAPIVAVLIIEFLGKVYMPLIILPALIMTLYFVFEKNIAIKESHGFSLHEWFSSLFMSGRELFILWLISSFRGIVLLLVGHFLPMLAIVRGASYAESAFFLSASLLAGLAGMFIGGYLSDIHGQKKVMAITMLISSPLLYAFLHTSGILSIMLLLTGMASLSSTIPVNIILAQRVNPKLAGMASSIVMGLPFAMGALTATPFGILADYVGIETAMNVPFILPVLGGITVFFLKSN